MVTETGLFGWVLDASLHWFGRAYTKLTFLISFMILMVPLRPMARLVEKLPGSSAARTVTATPRSPTQVASHRRRLFGWTGAALVVLPWVLGVPIGLWCAARAKDEAGTRLEQPERPEQFAPQADMQLPTSERRVFELLAVPQTALGLTLTRRRQDDVRSYYYVPLTAANWTARDPVQFILSLEYEGDPTPVELRPPYVVELDAGPVPTPVIGELERAGIELASPLSLVRRTYLHDGLVPDRSDSIMLGVVSIGWLSTLLGLMLWLVGFLVNVSHPALRRPDAE